MQLPSNDSPAINQSESKPEHWAQWIWRPLVGFTFCAVLLNNYVLVGYFPFCHPIPLPEQVWSAFLVILGASAAGRSFEKVASNKTQTNQ